MHTSVIYESRSTYLLKQYICFRISAPPEISLSPSASLNNLPMEELKLPGAAGILYHTRDPMIVRRRHRRIPTRIRPP
jgi:hypothetical protein